MKRQSEEAPEGSSLSKKSKLELGDDEAPERIVDTDSPGWKKIEKRKKKKVRNAEVAKVEVCSVAPSFLWVSSPTNL